MLAAANFIGAPLWAVTLAAAGALVAGNWWQHYLRPWWQRRRKGKPQAANSEQQSAPPAALQEHAEHASSASEGVSASSNGALPQQNQSEAAMETSLNDAPILHASGGQSAQRTGDPMQTSSQRSGYGTRTGAGMRPADSGELDARERGLHAERCGGERATSWPAASLKSVLRPVPPQCDRLQQPISQACIDQAEASVRISASRSMPGAAM